MTKIYVLRASDYDGSEVWKLCKKQKEAEKYMDHCKRLQKLYHDLREWESRSTNDFWKAHSELDDTERIDGWYKTQDWDTYRYWEEKIEKLFHELGTSSFYSQCDIKVMDLE